MSSEEYCRSHLRIAVAQICQTLGWNATQTVPLELLMDVTERYMEELAKTAHRFSEQFGRTQPNLEDLGLAFRLKAINVGELEEFVRHVEPVPFAHETIAFPAPKGNNLQFPRASSRELLHHREEHIHDHLPHMFPNMEDEAVEQNKTASTLTPQSEVPGNLNSDANTSVTGEKKAAATPTDPATPGKRPRLTASSLPEEAGHSQYEMSSVIMASDGTVIGLRGKGKLPDPCPPPPPIRHSVVVVDSTPAASKGDGSDANKENTAVEPSSKDPPVRISVTANKDGSTVVSSITSNKAKLDSAKGKGKKKEKGSVKEKEKKQKKKNDSGSDKPVNIVIGEKRPAPDSMEPGATPPAKKQKLKDSKVVKIKEKKIKEPKIKTPKPEKVKKKLETKKKMTPSLIKSANNSVVSDATFDSRLKDLLLSQDKYNLSGLCEPTPSTSSHSPKLDLISPPSPESDFMLRQAFPPTDIFDNNSRENSPERLIIAEAEGRAQEREEEKRIRLKNIDDTISAVIRDSALSCENKDLDQTVTVEKPVPLASPPETPRKRGRPKKIKPKDKIKSDEFINEDVIKKEKEDDIGARNIESINDTINSVIRQGSEDPKSPTPKPVTAEPSAASISPGASKKSPKDGKKRKVDKDKAPVVKKKLKAKLQNKNDKSGGDTKTLQSPPVDLKPFVSDKFSNAEMKVFEFGEADSPPSLPERRPSQAEKEPLEKELLEKELKEELEKEPLKEPLKKEPPKKEPPKKEPLEKEPLKKELLENEPPKRELSPTPAPATPTSTKSSFSPVDVKPIIIKSPTPEMSVAAASSASPSSAASASVDHQLIQPLKIEIPSKDKERHKEKSRDREHRKEKKEKRRDKEKKKKNKDRDRDKGRHDKHHREHKHDKNRTKEETPPSGLMGLKLKIKFGSKDNSSPSMVVTDTKTAEPPLSLPSPSPRPEIKLVIRRDAEGSSSQKKHSSIVSAHLPKSEPRNTPPTLHPASPLPRTPPPPVLSRNNSPVRERSPSPAPPPPAPIPPKTVVEVERSRSPVRKSPPQPEVFKFSSQNSPHRRSSVTPPPRTPSPQSPLPKSPSPMPKTPSPQRHYPASPLGLSSPLNASPAGRKSPTPTPKTPSLSPAYHSPLQAEYSPDRQERSPGPIKPLFGTPDHDTAPSSPVLSPKPDEDKDTKPPVIDPAPSSPLPTPKPKGKVGRPRLKSPRSASPKRKSPKSPRAAVKTPKTTKPVGTGKSTGRGRPPKAKTLALRAALAGTPTEDPSPAKSKSKSTPPPPLELEKEPAEDVPALSPLAVDMDKSALDSSSESPSPSQLSMDFSGGSSRQRGTVEAETVGSYIDSNTGQQVWICPSCKMQDDGSPMIGCDKCDDWYHWVCVNITKEPPEEQSWFCPRCSAKAKQFKPKGKRGRKKKIH